MPFSMHTFGNADSILNSLNILQILDTCFYRPNCRSLCCRDQFLRYRFHSLKWQNLCFRASNCFHLPMILSCNSSAESSTRIVVEPRCIIIYNNIRCYCMTQPRRQAKQVAVVFLCDSKSIFLLFSLLYFIFGLSKKRRSAKTDDCQRGGISIYNSNNK